MSEWVRTSLIDALDLIGGGTPKTSVSEYWNGAIPWLSVVDFNNGRKYVSNTEKSITELGLNNSSTKLLNRGDIIISARGTVGVLAVLDKQMAFNQSCYGIRPKEGINLDYLYYLLKTSVESLQQISHGGVFDTITRDTFKEIFFDKPPLSEQRAIAEILSSLDDKIELLVRQNKTLESLVETLFRHWFIDGAQAEWEILPLGDIANIQNGCSFKSSDFTDSPIDSYEVVKMGHIERGGGLKTNPKKSYIPREKKIEKYVLEKNDIILAMTDMKDNVVILGCSALIDKSDHYALNQRVARIYLKEDRKLLNQFLLYIQLSDKDFISNLQSKANSGVQVNLTTDAIKNSEIIVPPRQYQLEISEIISSHFERINQNRGSIQKLERLRDTLLPKLMSGEIRVNYEAAA